jgi:hypothetical protein
MDNESIKLALEKWAKDKGYESFSKILPSAPEIFIGSEEEFKGEGVFFLLRPSLVQNFRKDMTYFTKDGKCKSNRRKIPVEREYIIACWVLPSGDAWIYKSSVTWNGGEMPHYEFKTKVELIELLDNNFRHLNREYVLCSAVIGWLDENKTITERYLLGEDDYECFADKEEIIVPFEEWAIVKYVAEDFYEDDYRCIGVTDGGLLMLFYAGRRGLQKGPHFECLCIGDDVVRVLDQMNAEGLIS